MAIRLHEEKNCHAARINNLYRGHDGYIQKAPFQFSITSFVAGEIPWEQPVKQCESTVHVSCYF